MRSRCLSFLLVLFAVCWSCVASAQTVLSGNGPWVVDSRTGVNGGLWIRADLRNWQSGFQFQVKKFKKGAMSLLAKRGSIPTLSSFDAKFDFPERTEDVSAKLAESSSRALQGGDWYFAFSSESPIKLSVSVNRVFEPSPYGGTGSFPAAFGTTFRTFAPFATSINVAGSFNGWNSTQAPLVSEGNGYWSVHFRGVGHGDYYKFVVRNGATTLWQKDAVSRWVTNSVGESRVLDFSTFNWTDSGYSSPSWDDIVVYEMHVGTFHDSPGGAPGTFFTAIEKLDDLKDLGVNVIELLPVQEFAGDYSWGYNPSDPYSVESAYGGPLGLQQFVNEAHQRGIAVILDLVHNHYGPSDLGLWRYDGWSQGSYGGTYFYNDSRAVTPWGDTRPDYGRGEVRSYIRDSVMMFAEKYKIDGFRWDSVLNIRKTNWGDNGDGWSLVQWINNDLDSSQPWKINIAEDLQGNEWITKSTGAGGAGFDSQWTPSFVHPMRPVMTSVNDSDRNMNDVANALQQNYNGQWLQRVVYTESHDEVANGRSRVPQEIDPGNPGSFYARKRSTLGAVVTLTAPGIPMLFQGQEFLEDGYFRDDDPLDWTKATTYSGIRQMYTDLIRLRRNRDGFSEGLKGPNLNVFHVNNGAKVIAYHRWKNGGAGDDVVVIANFSNTNFNSYSVGLPRPGQWNVVFNSDWNGYSADFGNTFVADSVANGAPMHGLGQSASFALPRYSAVILVQRPSSRMAR